MLDSTHLNPVGPKGTGELKSVGDPRPMAKLYQKEVQLRFRRGDENGVWLRSPTTGLVCCKIMVLVPVRPGPLSPRRGTVPLGPPPVPLGRSSRLVPRMRLPGPVPLRRGPESEDPNTQTPPPTGHKSIVPLPPEVGGPRGRPLRSPSVQSGRE